MKANEAPEKMKLVDKSALVAEIEKIRAKWFGVNNDFADGQKGALTDVISLINAIEVKEVDLEKEYEEFVVDDPIFGNFITNDTMGMELAKHFFELGVKTAQKGEEA